MDSPSTIEDPELYKEFKDPNRESPQTITTPAQPENEQNEDEDGMNKALQSPVSPAANTWSAIQEDLVLPDDDAVEYSNAVKLTVETLRKQACSTGERTNGTEMSEMAETEREGETTKDDWEADSCDHKPKKATVAPKRLSTKRKRRAQTQSPQRKAQRQRKRR
ncbi:hypothetical protein E8E11_003769 [Didymella keratinophila]|nr:hypothetical protein E8E11_003769 [Didymella keratinophila]